MPRHDPIAVALVQAIHEWGERRLFDEMDEDEPFLVRVPGEEHPLVATMIGESDIDPCMIVNRGPNAFAQVVNILSGAGEDDANFDEQSTMTLSLSPLSVIPPKLRSLINDAGIEARRESIVPFVACKPPHRDVRAPTRGEMRLLTICLEAILEAHKTGALTPKPLDRRRQRILQITVDEIGREADARVEKVPWPNATKYVPARSFLTLADVEPTMLREPVDWQMVFVEVPIAPFPDGRKLRSNIVAELDDGEILSTKLTKDCELDVLERQLADALSDFLPRSILFAEEAPYAAFSEQLSALGIEARLEPFHQEMRRFDDMFTRAIGPDEDGDDASFDEDSGFDPEAEPEIADDWRLLGEHVDEWVVTLSSRELVDGRIATERYFGSSEIARTVENKFSEFQPEIAFTEWLFADFRAHPSSQTIFEAALRDDGITPHARTLLAARRDARLSIFRVVETDSEETLVVEDVLDGLQFTLEDPDLAHAVVIGLFLPLRIAHVPGFHIAKLAGPPLNGFEVQAALLHLEKIGVELTPAGMRRNAHLVGSLWKWLLEALDVPPRFVNTHDEALLFHTATFRVADMRAFEAALTRRKDVRDEPSTGGWVWREPANPALPKGEQTVLAHMQMMDDRLVLEVNSAERLSRARSWLVALPGVSFERATTREAIEPDAPLDDRLPGPDSEPDPEAVAAFELRQREYMKQWCDESIPALGGMTPREACQTPEGRRRVERLVRTMPDPTYPGGSIRAPREEVLRELGLLG
ncbi:MAG: antitoxin Xre/MbcA/ParS toxin-binding domain-containing protein [Planctomycetota bacterium]|nr:antitoxin Xre/MbcA/ParS toxin-binding domain-containing protein [Planctomycetota bacterium]